MTFRRFFGKSLLASLVLLVTACGPSVDVTGSWKNPEAKPVQEYNKVMVNAMVANEQTKRALEDAIENQLEAIGVTSTKGHELFPTMFTDRFNNDKDEMLQKIQETDNDAILTVSLLDKETETRYVQGTGGPYRPMGTYSWYGSFWGYHDYYYPMVYDPGYYTTTKVYYIEANLYDAENERLVWSAQTETYDPAELDEFSENFADAIVSQLNDEELIAASGTVGDD